MGFENFNPPGGDLIHSYANEPQEIQSMNYFVSYK